MISFPRARDARPDCVVAVESMGYLFGVPVALELGTRLVVARKGGRLPQEVDDEDYDVVYAKRQRIEVTADAINAGDRVLIVDDIPASGGTVRAVINLIERAGASVCGIEVFMEAVGFPTRADLESDGYPLHAAITWPETKDE